MMITYNDILPIIYIHDFSVICLSYVILSV
jgi:hypothetical protein